MVGVGGTQVRLFDVETMRLVRTLKGHSARVSSLSWHGPTLSSGGRDSMIFNHDVRLSPHAAGDNCLRGPSQQRSQPSKPPN